MGLPLSTSPPQGLLHRLPHKRLLAIFKEACAKVGIQGVTLYQASRHSFALQRLQQGFSYEEVGAALGHSSPQTTRRYARLRAEQVKSVFEGARILPFPKAKIDLE
ncbi:tyrosine-type recombinase/integrase [Thermosulfurimonas marina]|uniref:tyrosine-type recombinase/integrase n=1 Tax=Thermosulfurimonas marina TaxID=2047767 RepID=UPI0024837C6E|nr:tyrosine-type recombinase/integrase [Thermosulfurimonas marina]